MSIYIPAGSEAFPAMFAAGWQLLVQKEENSHWVRGPKHCILVLNRARPNDPGAHRPRSVVITTHFAPVDVLDGRLARMARTKIYRTTCHRDGTVTIWDAFTQGWARLHASRVSDEVLATLTQKERDRIVRMSQKETGQ